MAWFSQQSALFKEVWMLRFHSLVLSGAMVLLAACNSGDGSRESSAEQSSRSGHGSASCGAGGPGSDPRACDPQDTKKTTICHIPPGNPANAHTLCVGNPAVPAHLDHGDYLGACQQSCSDAGADSLKDGGVTPSGDLAGTPIF
jgi:hypothetical protein